MQPHIPIIPIVFGLGLFFLLSRGMMWPGIVILIGSVAALQSMVYGKNSQHAMRLVLIGVAFFLMFGLKLWFPGIILLIAMNAILSHMFSASGSRP